MLLPRWRHPLPKQLQPTWLHGSTSTRWLHGSTPKRWLHSGTPNRWLHGSTPKRWLHGSTPKGWLHGSTPKGWLHGSAPKRCLAKMLLPCLRCPRLVHRLPEQSLDGRLLLLLLL